MEDIKNPLHLVFPVFTIVVYPSPELWIKEFSYLVDIPIGPSMEIRLAYLINNLLLFLAAYCTIIS